MKTLSDYLPGLGLKPEDPPVPVDWDVDATIERAVELIRTRLNQAQLLGDEVIQRLSNALIADLADLKSTEPTHREVFDVLQFDAAIAMMGRNASLRHVSALWEWTIKSLCDRPFEHVVDFDFRSALKAVLRVKRPILLRLLRDCFPEWARLFYYAACITEHPFQEAAADLLPFTLKFCEPRLYASEESAIEACDAIVQCLNWEASRDRPLVASDYAKGLYDAYINKAFSAEIDYRLGILFSSGLGDRIGLNSSQEAAKVRRRHSQRFRGHESLQTLIIEISGDVESAHLRKAEVLEAVQEYFRHQGTGERSLYNKGPLFSILVPFVMKLLKANRRSFATELISTWRGADTLTSPAEDVLLCIPVSRDGVAYSSPHGWQCSEQPLPIARKRLSSVVLSSNKATGVTHEVRNDNTFVLAEPERFGAPNYEAASEFESALREFYLCEAVRGFVSDGLGVCSAMALIPYAHHPVQALLAKYLKTALPFTCSWQRPREDRSIRKVLIYGDGVITGECESHEVARVFRRSGIDCLVVRPGAQAKAEFLRYYLSDEFDVIWVVAHGEFDHLAPHRAHIPSSDGDPITLEELATARVDHEYRRLLVFNMCSGGTSAAQGGLPDFGFGPQLARPSQAVISHLWPVWLWAPVAFGVILSGGLAERLPYFSAFRKCLLVLSSGEAEIVRELERLGASAELVRRTQMVEAGWDNILHWGSPVFLE